MIERVLVPLDGSLLAEQVLPQVRRLLYRSDSEVILVHASPPPPVESPVLIYSSMLAKADDYIRGVRDRLAGEGVRVKSVSRVGSPAGVILDVAEEEKATLLALATHGKTGFQRLLFGSVAESLLRRSSVPVFVVRPVWSYELLPGSPQKSDLQPIRTILLPVVGGDPSLPVIPPLVEFARLFESRVLILHVKESGTKGGDDGPEREQEELANLVACARRLEEHGVGTISLMEEGDPAETILQVARSQKVDLIAMATHGRSGIDRLLKGSITESVLRQSPCPMLVARSPGIARGKKQAEAVREARS